MEVSDSNGDGDCGFEGMGEAGDGCLVVVEVVYGEW